MAAKTGTKRVMMPQAGHPRTASLLSEMLNEARRYHATEKEAQARVLIAWAMLRSRRLWTSRMAQRLQEAAAVALVMLALLAAPASAAKTTVSEAALTAGDGSPATGTIEIRPYAAFTAADGTRVEGTVERQVRNGRFSVDLEPGVYRVRVQLEDAAPRDAFWVVPVTGPVGLCAVEATRVSGAWVTPGCTSGALSWATVETSKWGALSVQQWGTLVQ